MAQTLGGTGTLELFSAAPNDTVDQYVQVRPTGTGSLTIGENITVRNATNSYGTTLGDAGLSLAILGTVIARSTQPQYGTLRITGTDVIT